MPLFRARCACFAISLLLTATAAACSTFSEEESSPTPTPDAAVADASIDDASEVDATIDASPDAPADAPYVSNTRYADEVRMSNPLRYFRFAEPQQSAVKFVDSSGSATAAIATGSVVAGQPGAIPPDATNLAVSISGPMMSYLDCGSPAGLTSAVKLTIEAWVNPAAGIVGDQAIVTNQIVPPATMDAASTAPAGVVLRLLANLRVQLGVGDGASTYLATGGSALQAGQWAHVVASYDASQASAPPTNIWINGIVQPLDVTGATSPPILPKGGNALRIGRSAISPAQQYTGLVDEVAIYLHPFTDAEVQAHFVASKPSP